MKANSIVNRNYYIKVYGLGYNTLVGWPTLVEILGEHLANKVLAKALTLRTDKATMKFRRGLKVDIYPK